MNVYVHKNGSEKQIGKKIAKTRDVGWGVYLDFNSEGDLIGVEIISATAISKEGKLQKG